MLKEQCDSDVLMCGVEMYLQNFMVATFCLQTAVATLPVNCLLAPIPQRRARGWTGRR